MGKGRLKQPQINKGNKVGSPEEVNITNHKHPIFCFKYLHKDYCLDHCTNEEKIALIEQVTKLSQLTWTQIELSGRHGMGSEKIAINSIKTGIPMKLTDDVSNLLALRFLGKKPFVGHRDKFIFHILYIDRAFSLYNH